MEIRKSNNILKAFTINFNPKIQFEIDCYLVATTARKIFTKINFYHFILGINLNPSSSHLFIHTQRVKPWQQLTTANLLKHQWE